MSLKLMPLAAKVTFQQNEIYLMGVYWSGILQLIRAGDAIPEMPAQVCFF